MRVVARTRDLDGIITNFEMEPTGNGTWATVEKIPPGYKLLGIETEYPSPPVLGTIYASFTVFGHEPR